MYNFSVREYLQIIAILFSFRASCQTDNYREKS